jgi:hypothetical protein
VIASLQSVGVGITYDALISDEKSDKHCRD